MRRRRRKGRRRRRRRRKKKKKKKQQQQPPPRQKRKQKPPEGSEPAARHPRGCAARPWPGRTGTAAAPGRSRRRTSRRSSSSRRRWGRRCRGLAAGPGRARALSLPPGMRGRPAGGCGSLRGDLRTRECCSAPRASSRARGRSDVGARRKIEWWGRSWASITPHPSPIPPEKAIKRKKPKCFKIFIERGARGRFFLGSATVNKCGLTCTLPLKPMAAAIRGQTSRNNRSGLDVL